MNLADAFVGIGLRPPHYDDFFQYKPSLALVELHSENHFILGAAGRDLAIRVADVAPLSLHGVGLSLGSADGLDTQHLDSLVNLANDVQPTLISEHLCWGRIGAVHTHDLLPLPYCHYVLDLLVERIDQVQQALGREIAIENVSTYINLPQHAMPEWEFLALLIERANCGLLLDINNIFVNAHNHNFSMNEYFSAVPWHRVREVHVAGHQAEGELLVDTHSGPVCAEVLYWLDIAKNHLPFNTALLLEWDAELPSFSELLKHASDLQVSTPGSSYALV